MVGRLSVEEATEGRHSVEGVMEGRHSVEEEGAAMRAPEGHCEV